MNRIFKLSFTVALAISSWIASAQCIGLSNSPASTATPAAGATSPGYSVFPGSYSTWFSIVVGPQYIITSTNSADYFTVRSGTSSGTLVAFGQTPLSWTANTAGIHYISIHSSSACSSSGSSRTITMSRTGGSGCNTGTLSPATSFTPSCTGSAQSIATSIGTGYSNVVLTNGVPYTFTSSLGTDQLTITNSSGTIQRWGSSPFTYVPATTATYRIYTHSTSACGTTGTRTRSISCPGQGGAGDCLSGTQYPTTIFTPTCDGTPQFITGAANYGEFSNVALVNGTAYTFTCSNGGYVTISNNTATTELAAGSSPFVWTATASGTYRYYIHANATCGSGGVAGIRRIQCGTAVVVPGCATSPTPADASSACITSSTTLSWPAVATATGYDVYFNAGATATSLVSSDQVGLSYNASTPTVGTYSWRIEPRNSSGPATGCATWNFIRTAAPLWYADQDGDGLGDPSTSVAACTAPAGHVSNDLDACPFAVDGIANFNTTACNCNAGYFQTITDMGGNDVITACTICPPGYFCADGLDAVPCPAGRFQDQQGQTQCIACAAGFFNGQIAQTSCTPCPAGTASNVTGAQTCPPCAANTYNPNEGQTTCTACPNGESSGVGATECTPDIICTTDLDLVFQTDGVTNIGWEIREQGTDALVQSGGGVYEQSLGYGISTCVPDGCYYLVVTSDLGGIVQNSVQGGYILSTVSGDRIIDNRNNFLNGSNSQIAGGEGFCFPMATTPRVIYTSCDKLNWNVGPCDGSAPSNYKSEFIVAGINAAVSGDYPNAQSGFTFWFYNPNGNYNFRRFRSHAQGEGAPLAAADRYTHCLLNNWAAANALQQNTLYNVRVRAVVNNIPGEFGPACRMMLDQTGAQCPVTKLMDAPGHSQLSCGQNRDWGNGNYVYARPVWRYNNNCVKVNANRYRFRFYQTPEESYDVTVTSGNYARQLNWGIGAGAPLAAGETYKVIVEASFDNGASYCAAGDMCLLTINLPGEFQGGNQNFLATSQSELPLRGSAKQNDALRIYPNPNRGEQLYLALAAVEEGVNTVSVDIYDLFGKRVSARTIAVNDGFISTMLELNGELAAGMYMVNITAGEMTYTERLVIQP